MKLLSVFLSSQIKAEEKIKSDKILTKKGCVIILLPKERVYTIEDIYALPEGERAELMN